MDMLGKPPPNTSSDNCNTNVTFLVNADDIPDPLTQAVVFVRSRTCTGAGGRITQLSFLRPSARPGRKRPPTGPHSLSSALRSRWKSPQGHERKNLLIIAAKAPRSLTGYT